MAVFSYQIGMSSLLPIANQGKDNFRKNENIDLNIFMFRFLASLLVELGEYDISGPNEYMSTREKKVSPLQST